MTEKSWPWSTVAAKGDGSVPLGESDSRLFLATMFLVQDPAVEGVCKGVLNELAVTGVASPLSIATGAGVCYGLYINDTAPVTKTVATPAVGTTGGRVVLQTNWAGTGGAGLEAKTRIAVKLSADGSPAIPTLTQVVGTTWEISLASFTITTGGVITVTDARTFRKVTGTVGTNEILANAVGDTDLRDSAALSVIGRGANSIGDPADLVAGSDGYVLRRAGTTLAFGQIVAAGITDATITEAKLAAAASGKLVTNGNTHDHNGGDGAQIPTGGIANDAIDDTKAGNRVPQFIRRKGGNATDWSIAGSNDYTPTTVRMQAGVVTGAGGGGGTITVTFPVAFSNKPIGLVSIQACVETIAFKAYTSASQIVITWDTTGIGEVGPTFAWFAVGPE